MKDLGNTNSGIQQHARSKPAVSQQLDWITEQLSQVTETEKEEKSAQESSLKAVLNELLTRDKVSRARLMRLTKLNFFEFSRVIKELSSKKVIQCFREKNESGKWQIFYQLSQ